MQTVIEQQNSPAFVDRRELGAQRPGGAERRQFSASASQTNPDVAEMSKAVDEYKLLHRRRFITFEELHNVICKLGYHK